MSLKHLTGRNPPSDTFRFNASYIPEPNSGCWLWLGRATGSNGYGSIIFKKRNMMAHRASWEIHCSEIPNGLLVLHKCDTPLCVNPSHLFLGTPHDNTKDMISKGRDKFLECGHSRIGAMKRSGEHNPKSRLTWDAVNKIRSDNRKSKDIAADFGVTWQTINDVKAYRTWNPENKI